MTQSQLTFAGATSILAWAGRGSVLQFIMSDLKDFTTPYVRKDGTYYYFVSRPNCYELIMTSTLDLNGE